MRNLVLRLRRFLLKALVPEFVWPRHVSIDGVTVKLRGAPYSFAIKRLLAKNSDSYERAERRFLDQLREDDHVLEYGSSIGILTALICERVPRGKVISVEVSRELVEYSRSWLAARYEQLTLVNAAAFPVYQGIPLTLSFNDSSGSLGGIVNYQKSDSQDVELDSFFIKDAESITDFKTSVLIIDIEGSEDIILREEMKLPISIDRIIIELHAFIYGAEVETSIIEKIVEQGFVLQARVESVHFFSRAALD